MTGQDVLDQYLESKPGSLATVIDQALVTAKQEIDQGRSSGF